MYFDRPGILHQKQKTKNGLLSLVQNKTENNMNFRKVLFWSITVALGGFLFGFDTAVISGAEQDIQKIWGLDSFTHGLAVAIALYGTILGALFGGWPSDRLGRRTTLFWIGILYFVSAAGCAVAPDVYTFMFARFIGGLGVGASSVAAPMYISEISPAHSRGKLVALFQFNVVLGIVIAYFSNYIIDLYQIGGANAWRWMLGIEALPAALFVLLVKGVPESPRWLILKKGDVAGARAVFAAISPATVDQEIAAIQGSHHEKNATLADFFSRRFAFPIILAFLFAFFNQMAGINAIIYYTKRIFELTGQASTAALASTVGIGLINLLFTMLGMYLIDRTGRRFLMFAGSFGLIFTLGMIAMSFLKAGGGADSAAGLGAVPIYLFAYIAFFALSQGAVIWVFISEIFPNEVRAYGQSLGSFSHWLFAAIIANVFPLALERFGPGNIFLFFTFMMVIQLLYVWRLMPETKGISLEDLEKKLVFGRKK